MAKYTNNSRLKETDYSAYNLRDALIQNQVEYLSTLRDEALFSNMGIKVLIKIPSNDNGDVVSNNVDEYSNFVDTVWMDTTETVIPKFSEYRQLLNENGMTADGIDADLPLEVIIPSKLYIPRNSRLIFNEYDVNDDIVTREWVVLGTVQKQLSGSKTYTRILNCVPARQSFFASSTPSVGKIYFDIYNLTLDMYKDSDIRSIGRIWFNNTLVNTEDSFKVFHDEISEELHTPEDVSNYQEDVNIPYFYDESTYNIISKGKGFYIGQEIDLCDSNNNKISVLVDPETKERVDLKIIVKDVDLRGGIIDFEYNVERVYTIFSNLIAYTDKNINDSASINIRCEEYEEDIYYESIEKYTPLAPKYFTVYASESVFTSKKIAVSVLI